VRGPESSKQGLGIDPSLADPARMAPSKTRPFDRHALRAISRRWCSLQRRLLIERVLEHAREEDLERLLKGLVHLDAVRSERVDPRSLVERVAAHVSATRSGAFLGEYVLRNAHGQREPWQTRAWVAATAHLFDLASDRGTTPFEEGALHSLIALVGEVDERTDELVEFEDSCASAALWDCVERARALLVRR